jgi:uncharacterized protein (DUF362 family)
MCILSIVYFSENLSREEFADQVLEIFRPQLGRATKIFVKPNVVSYEKYPTTTHPMLLESVLKRLDGHEVFVGDAPAIDAGRPNKIIQKSPLKRVCENYGVRLMNLYDEKMTTMVSPRGYRIRVSTLPLECDFVISLPVLKAHGTVGLSGAIKNQFGYIGKLDRLLMHTKAKDIEKGIAEVNSVVPSNLFIVDGVETMVKAQECRHGGCPAKLNVLLAGTDPVSLDVFGLHLLEKVEPKFEEKRNKAWRYIEYAAEYCLGIKDFRDETLA